MSAARYGESDDGGADITYSFSFFPLRRFLPPFPLFLGILAKGAQAISLEMILLGEKIVVDEGLPSGVLRSVAFRG